MDRYFIHPSSNFEPVAAETNILPIFSTSSDVCTELGDSASCQTSVLDDFRVLIIELKTLPTDTDAFPSSGLVLGLDEPSKMLLGTAKQSSGWGVRLSCSN